MLGRVFAIAMNTYREAVRARILLGLLALALGTSAYSVVVASMSVRQETRIVSDLGASSTSLYAVLVAIILGATSLYRELELKTIFPILTRRLRRHEYIVGKYLGILSVLLAFVALDGATILGILAVQSKDGATPAIAAALALLLALGVALVRAKLTRVFLILPWSIVVFVVMALLSGGAGGERQLVIVSMALTMAEVAIVAAVAMVFSSFSSPFLTAIFTIMLFLIGRSADTLGNLPEKVFGSTIRAIGIALSKIIPNLNAYVPARPLLLGQIPSVSLAEYVSRAWLNAILYAALLLALSALVFRKRDFQ
jgi:ABC-type transport system involved in multi-copper enzyme maturation permease subunit